MNRSVALLVALLAVPAWGQTSIPPSLVLGAGDVRVVPKDDGLHLLVRQKTGLASVMLTESYETPDHKVATYSWRGTVPNAVNGPEKRLLNGQFLKGPNLFLISSTVVADPLMGPVFEVLIPPKLEFGNQSANGSRHGTLDVTAELATAGKVWFSIRTFAKPYQDYTGAYTDNAFELSRIVFSQVVPVDENKYVKGFEDLFRRLGPTEKAVDASAGVDFLKTLLTDDTDLVLVLDATKSMTVDLKALRESLLPSLDTLHSNRRNLRLGLVLYKDYGEPWVTQTVPLSADWAAWTKAVAQASAAGGGDVPEAVVEALDEGLGLLRNSKAVHRMLVVFGDAPQHDSPRGRLKESEVIARIAAAGAGMQLIMLPVTPY